MSPARQLIYTHGGGRLGNQILRFMHWIAWACEQNGDVEVRDLAFWPYAHFFDLWRQHPGCVFPPRPDRWDEAARWWRLLPESVRHRLDWRAQKAVHALGRRLPGWQTLDASVKNRVDLASPHLRERLQGATTTLCAGWEIAGWDLVVKHAATLRRCFQPERAIQSRAEQFVSRLRQRHGFLLGVFVRQEDYRQWHGGRFYHAETAYAEWVRQALAMYGERNPAVMIAASEWQGGQSFRGLPVFPSTGNTGRKACWFDQWAQLALCDLILSVPSTFAATAAFRGNVPLWPICAAGQVLEPSQIITDNLLGAARHRDFSIAVN